MDQVARNEGNTASPSTIGDVFAAGRNRGPGFDTVRLAAASCVVFHHSLAIKYDIVAIDTLNWFSHGYTNLGFLSVSVFFALSGFLVTPGLVRNGDVLEYLSRRLVRIMPLFALVIAANALVVGPLTTTLPIDAYFAHGETWRYFRNLTTWLSLQLPGVVDYDGGDTINGPIWTLHYEWLCYLLLAVLQLLSVTRKRNVFLGIWALSVLASALIFYGVLPGGLRALRYFELTSYFGAGSLVYLFRDRLPWSKAHLGLAVLALVGLLWANLGVLFAPILVSYLVVGIGLLQFPWAGLLAKADLSYGVYLLHSVVFLLIMHFTPVDQPLVLFLIGWPAAMILAWGSWTFIEKPALRYKDVPARWMRTLLGPRISTLLKRGATAS